MDFLNDGVEYLFLAIKRAQNSTVKLEKLKP